MSHEIGRCPQCDTPIADNYRYSWCIKCTEPLPEAVTKLLPFLDSTIERPLQSAGAAGGAGVSMDLQKLTKVLLVGGGVMTCVAVAWWAYFYNQAIQGLTGGRGSLTDAFSCLYSSGGPCGFVSGLAQFGGVTPYNPAAFWVGTVLLGVGLVLRLSAGSSPGSRSST